MNITKTRQTSLITQQYNYHIGTLSEPDNVSDVGRKVSTR